MKAFVDSILSEEEGFSFGEPWNYEKSLGAVLPILRKGRRPRKYRTLEEALKDTKDAVEVTETGSIRKVKVLNRTDRPIFVRMGTIFTGEGTQSRAAEGSVILVPHKEAEPVEVRCVEASVPIVEGTAFRVAGFSAPRSVELGLYSRDQGEVWERVRSYTRAAAVPAERGQALSSLWQYRRQDSLVDVLTAVEEFKEQVDEVLEEVPNYEDQVGLVVLDKQGVVGLEAFDTPQSWRAVSDVIVKKYADVISLQVGEDTAPVTPNHDVILKRTRKFLEALVKVQEEVTFEASGHKTFALAGKGVVGEYTTIDGSVIHLTGVRFERRKSQRLRERPRERLREEAPRGYAPQGWGERGTGREEGVREGP
ncbi:MAG: ARPP-1 family domain-containing protein [Thermoplasmata archaeon]